MTNNPTRIEQFIRDTLSEIRSHARGMWRYRWRAVIAMWVISVLGWSGAYSMPDVYSASARVFVDTENAIRPLLQGIAVSSDVMSEVSIVTREMLSRPILAEVARDTDLDLRAESEQDMEDLLRSLRSRIGVVGSREHVYSISFQDPDRDKAVAVVDALLNTFVEKSLGGNRTESDQAQQFLTEQIALYEERLTAAEDRLADFKRENVALISGQGGDYFERLQSSQNGLAATQAKLTLAEERRSELLRQIEGEEPTFGIMPSGSGADQPAGFAGAKIRELESQLEELRLRYTDKHPRIGQILETIELLKNQAAEERAAGDAGGAGAGFASANSLETNPVYQNMRIQLTNTEVEIASLRAEALNQRNAIRELQQLVDTVPQVEAQLGRLNRDYGVVQAKYEQLLQQLESANIGEDVEESINEVQFRIIEPPYSSLSPVGPKRQLFLAAVFIAALGVGVALTFLLNLLHPVFFNERTVSNVSGLPVLGSVSFVRSHSYSRQARLEKLRISFAMGALVVCFGLVSMFADQWSPALRGLTSVASL